MTRSTSPRLVPLAVAERVLGGRHPILLGIGEALEGLYDLKAIHAALDRKAGLTVEMSVDAQGPANDTIDADELAQLAKRIKTRAARRS
jgi:hypothetical protein